MDWRRRYQLVSLLAPIVLWQAVVSFGIVSTAVLPPPIAIAGRTVTLFGEAGFLEHLIATLRRTALASVFATFGGSLVGFAMAAHRTVRAVLSPVVAAIFALPVVAMFPLVILVLASEGAAIVFTAAVGSFILVVWNARNGARSVDPVFLEVARDNGARSPLALLREVWLPGALPLVFVGARLGLSMSLLIVVAVEFIAGNDGLGYVLWISWQAYQLPGLYATLVVVGGIGLAITEGLARLRERVIPWDQNGHDVVVGP
ncbi:MAG: ABC transporter permease [Halodesulfurarchaeum sp.]